MAAKRILILGASYGSLLGVRIAMAGHDVTLVCLPAEAELINAAGAIVRMPVKGREGLVEINSTQPARRSFCRWRGRRGSRPIRSRRSRHAGAAVSLPRRPRVDRGDRRIASAMHVDHEHASAVVPEAHSHN